MRVAIIGQGYVGLPLAIAAAKCGHFVIGVDKNETLVEKLKNTVSPIPDVSEPQIVEVQKYYFPTSSIEVIADCEIIILCVPTPLDANGMPDLSLLIVALEQIQDLFQEGSLIVIESTISPGTTKGIVREILKKSGKKFSLAYSPERVDPSNKSWSIQNTPKLVSGIDPISLRRSVDFYKTFIENVIEVTSVEVAETAKLLENTFRLVNIALVSEVAQFCRNLGIDVNQVVAAAASKPYGFMPFYPSVGVGGHCIPVDPVYLISKADEIGTNLKLPSLAIAINNNLPTYFADLAKQKLGGLSKKHILVIGIAYKPNVTDIRESKAIELINLLRKFGAVVDWHDNLVKNWGNEKSTPISNRYDLIIVANLHSYISLDEINSNMILDTRGSL
jgi:UDP-N-acetyl-D-glucosamine dehydrogenase